MHWGRLAIAVGIATLSLGGPARGESNPCASGPNIEDLIPTTNYPGIVVLHFRTARDVPVSFYECVDGQPTLLGTATSPSVTTDLSPATWWRCDRLVRRFVATATLPDGTPVRGAAAIRTMSCAHRYEMRAPTHAARGSKVRVRIFDHWNMGGIRAKLCVTAPGDSPPRCRHVSFAVGINVVARSLRLGRRGVWRVFVKAPHARLRTTIGVGVRADAPRPRLPAVLATGDSTMLGTESFLADDLDRRAGVVGDVHPGTSISQTNEWARLSPGQVRSVRPVVTVLSIGANEGYPMSTPGGLRQLCCDAGWASEWRRRLELSLRDYLRHGRVLLLTQPVQRDPARRPITAAVNAALLRAADDLDGVDVLRLDRVFTPDGYRAVMRYRGRQVRVRMADGVHLSPPGTAIAARLAAQALIHRGWVAPRL